jgi:hypothetical protein
VGTDKNEGILLRDVAKLKTVQEMLKINIEWTSLCDKCVTILLFVLTVLCFGTLEIFM